MNEIAPMHPIGAYVPMVDGPEKVSGRAKYTADCLQPRCWRAHLSQPYAHAEIIEVDTARPPGCRRAGDRHRRGLRQDLRRPAHRRSEHPLARDKVRYKGEPVAAWRPSTRRRRTRPSA
jgi:4-hydroxybenzoyl-CoA reductase subunit alpha